MARLQQRERLSALLISHCRANNLSGTQLAALLEVSQPSAQAYLDGRTYPGEEVRKRIAKVLNLTPEELQAKIDGLSLNRKLSADELAREIRLISQTEFEEKIVPVVFHRIEESYSSRINR